MEKFDGGPGRAAILRDPRRAGPGPNFSGLGRRKVGPLTYLSEIEFSKAYSEIIGESRKVHFLIN